MRTARGIAVAALALAALSGCASPTAGPLEPNAGGTVDIRGEWTLVGGSDANGPLTLSDLPVTVEFIGQNARVRTGCMSFDQPLGREIDVTTIALGARSTASCVPLSPAETSAIHSLAAVTGAERDGDALTLFGPDVELELDLVPAVAIDDAAGTWSLDGSVLFGDMAVMTDLDARVVIDSDGVISGSTGCADFSGAIDIVSGTNTISDLEFVDIACAADDAAPASTVREILEGGFLLHLGGAPDAASRLLTLVAASSEATLTFAPVA